MASVALLTVTGILSQAVGFAYRVGLTRLPGRRSWGCISSSCRSTPSCSP